MSLRHMSRSSSLVLASCLVVAVATSLFGQVGDQAGDLAGDSERAREFVASGQPEKAIPIYQQLVKAVPNNPGLMTNLGIAQEMAGHDREAIEEFNAVLKMDPEYLNARLFLGLADLDVGNLQEGIGQLQKVIDRQPGNELARWKLGEAYLSTGNNVQAAEEYQDLCNANPRNPKGWYGLGQSFLALSQATVGKLRQLAPYSGYTLALAAEADARQRQYAAAVQFYRQALQKLPNLPGLHAAVAEVYRAAGHPEWAAVEEKREHLIAPPCDTQPLACDFQGARYEQLVEVASREPSAESYYWEAKSYERLGLAAFDHLRELPPGLEFYEMKAETDLNQGEFRECVKDWQEALELSPNSSKIKKNLAIAYRQTGDQEDARQLLEGLVKSQLKSQPEEAELDYLLGDTLLSLHQPAQAIPVLERSLRLRPGLLAAESSLAKAYLETGRPKEAIPHFKAALPADEDGALYADLARAYQQVGQPALAGEMIKRYQEIRGTRAKPKQLPQLEPPPP
jgi:predicted Zn-dependent protease